MEFFRLLGRQDEVVRDYLAAFQAANDAREIERRAATVIQSAYRGSVIRHRFHLVVWASLEIQRRVRGVMGMRIAQVKRLDRHRLRNQAFFDHTAAIIQKHFRGYWSRLYRHDFYARRKYLRNVDERGVRTVTHLQKRYEKELSDQEHATQLRMKKEFTSLTSQLHHLVSTQIIPGVYNPPYSDTLPKAFGIPVEEHLRKCNPVRLPASLRRPLYRNRTVPPGRRLDPIETVKRPGTAEEMPRRQKLHSTTATVGRHRPIQGPFRTREEIALSNARAYSQYRSIQADSTYDTVRESERMQEKLSKMTRVGSDEFVHRKVNEKPFVPTANAETDFPHRPVEFREDYTEVPKIGNKPPYFVAMPAGKLFAEYEDPLKHLSLQGGV
jgi:hypothetical protein